MIFKEERENRLYYTQKERKKKKTFDRNKASRITFFP